MQCRHCLTNPVRCSSFKTNSSSPSRCRVASLFHVSTYHQLYLKLRSSSRNPQHRAPFNPELKELLGIQADVAPAASVPRLARDACCASRIICLEGRIFIGRASCIHGGSVKTHRRDSQPSCDQIPSANTVFGYVHDRILLLHHHRLSLVQTLRRVVIRGYRGCIPGFYFI